MCRLSPEIKQHTIINIYLPRHFIFDLICLYVCILFVMLCVFVVSGLMHSLFVIFGIYVLFAIFLSFVILVIRVVRLFL